ncbi:flagellar biosynthesis protein FlgB [Erwinia typographi]|uniref:Flagellar basal body rod protein FlgB n=1 Tax=Erwinia typographi TaxID=371042 RepID=A0A0A3Z6L5_9GAMM|nr:flagellar basal body rod protein FlgB [Erwinia typographi]KGT93311.1 flagellar biosynthesis protein FlgB [Erwinia typographi]
MLDKLDNDLRFQQEALKLLNHRQEILASNIANADTPGYMARDIDFSQSLKNVLEQQKNVAGPLTLNMTSSRHIKAEAAPFANSELLYRVPDQPSADGNTVDMDRERVNFADNSVKYQSNLTFLGAQFKSMMTVLSQG